MRRGDCPAVFSLEILRRNPCTGEESAPREIGQGIRQIFKQTGAAFCSRNTFAPRNGIFIQIPQGLARRGFKNQNPARGRKQRKSKSLRSHCAYLRTRTPQGDGNKWELTQKHSRKCHLRTRTPQGDGNDSKNIVRHQSVGINLRTRTPQGDGNLSYMETSTRAI